MEPLIFIAALALAWYLRRDDTVSVSASASIAETEGGPAPTPEGAKTGLDGSVYGTGAPKGGASTQTVAGTVSGKPAKAPKAGVDTNTQKSYTPDPVQGFTKGGKTVQTLPGQGPRPVEVAK